MGATSKYGQMLQPIPMEVYSDRVSIVPGPDGVPMVVVSNREGAIGCQSMPDGTTRAVQMGRNPSGQGTIKVESSGTADGATAVVSMMDSRGTVVKRFTDEAAGRGAQAACQRLKGPTT